MKKLFLLISILSVGIISHATAASGHISGVKFNNICTSNSSSTNNEDFRHLNPIMIYNGYSENCEIELNWTSPDKRPDKIRFWIDVNDDKQEAANEYFFYNINVSGNFGSKKKVTINNISTPSNSNLKKDVALNMKITMVHEIGYGYVDKVNSELYWVTFRSVDFPHITQNRCQTKTINDPKPDFLVNFSHDSKTDSPVSFNYVKGTILPGILSVKRENSSIVPKYLRVYIDFDENGSFSSTEKIFDYSIPVWSNDVLTKTVTYNISVPTSKTVILNSAYKLKVEVVNANNLGEGHVYSLFFKSSSAKTSEESQSDVEQTYNSRQYEENVADVLIYPNPANDNFSIKYFSNENYEININLISETGQSRFQKDYNVFKGNNLINISTESLPKGVFIVEIIGNNGVKVYKKMVIQ